ncbi:methylthioribulose 1-phosphate dehydratase [Brunnivagina elsteri]|uniref:Methylthioribulose-1-phosphate dehydratase n=1 Tax=Brunnivagina elsteri CCALA 953 TaxID=987040 RepID=A0A2A2TMG8_9CYAN|nr:methylthioribulose 1-phosphate dehydratase [Calothrix elsteri]PAX59622.1 methylthioribulose 1-phosphate dehydratase [Calothrix elsteri CCALA 953]
MTQQQLLNNITIEFDPRSQLCEAASHFYKQGWMLGTAGNLSVKLKDGSFWITGSGKSKGELCLDDFVRVYPDVYPEGTEAVINEAIAPQFKALKPSAETSIHQVIYEIFPEVCACYHVHSIEANLVSNFVEGDELPLPALEMLKGLGVWEENPNCTMPLFTNHFHVPKIAADIRSYFQSNQKKQTQVPALLIRNHGITVWANSPKTAFHYIEVAEYIFRYMVAAKKAGI